MKKLVSVLVAVFALCCFSGSAHAKGIPIVYQTGEDIFVAGDGSLPPELAEIPELAGHQSGYRCDVFAIMFAYFSVSNCRAVVFEAQSYVEEPEISAAVSKLYPESEMDLGLWGGYGKFPLGLAILIGLGLAVWGFFSPDEDEREEEEKAEATG